MEGFLQSLKQKDVGKQRQVCRMTGREAKRMTNADWQTNQTVWWNGQAIDRQSDVFLTLIKNAYEAMFEQNECFRTALMDTRGKMLYHSQGEQDFHKTILTEREFCGILTDLRDSYDFRDKTKKLEEKSIRRKKLMYLHGFGSSAASGTTCASTCSTTASEQLAAATTSWRWVSLPKATTPSPHTAVAATLVRMSGNTGS